MGLCSCLCGLTAGIIKYLMFAANVLFMLTGIAVIVVGVKIQQNFADYDSLLDGKFSGTAIAIIVIGSLICIIGFCGCCGAIRKSHCLLITYSVLLICVFVAEIAIGIVALTQVNDTQDFMKNRFDEFFLEEWADGTSETFEQLQREFSCCGVIGPSDYSTIPGFPSPQLPDSCCKPGTAACTDSPSVSYMDGCRNKFTDYVSGGVQTVGIVTLCVALSELIAIVFACCLAGRYKEKNENHS